MLAQIVLMRNIKIQLMESSNGMKLLVIVVLKSYLKLIIFKIKDYLGVLLKKFKEQ